MSNEEAVEKDSKTAQPASASKDELSEKALDQASGGITITVTEGGDTR